METAQLLDRPVILVVDDEPGLREVMAIELDMYGYRVLTAPSGHAAFELIQSTHIDWVVSDVRMDQGDGLELLDRIQARSKSTGQRIPVILMSGFAGVTLEEAQARGAVTVLQKPFRIEEILAGIGAPKRVSR